MVFMKSFAFVSALALFVGPITGQYNMPYNSMAGPPMGGNAMYGGGPPGQMFGNSMAGGPAMPSSYGMPGVHDMAPMVGPGMDGSSDGSSAEADGEDEAGGSDGGEYTEYAGDDEDPSMTESLAESYVGRRRRRSLGRPNRFFG